MEREAVSGTSKGRYTTYFVEYLTPDKSQLSMVLRHYYRGGLVRHLSLDSFVYTGLGRTRSVAELNMLQRMYELGLPVPKPIAARVERVNGLWCKNDILIETIDKSQDCFNALKNNKLSSSCWFNIGQTIRRFHDLGVDHTDLNIHNILLNEREEVFLIDFDRCAFRTQVGEWKEKNLQRLQRSLLKERSLHLEFNYSATDWQQLLAGYNR
mgnify:CR=1 FL=1